MLSCDSLKINEPRRVLLQIIQKLIEIINIDVKLKKDTSQRNSSVNKSSDVL